MGWLVIVVVLSLGALIIPFLEILVVIAANAIAFILPVSAWHAHRFEAMAPASQG